MKVFNRADFPTFDWDTLNGKHGTIRIGRDGFNDLVAFHEDDGGLYVLAWIERAPGD